VLKSLDQYYLIDDEGIVVKTTADSQNLLVVEDTVEESFATGEALPNPKLAPFIISTNQSWSGKLTSSITGVKFPGKASNEVHFTSSEGWIVFFDINRSAISQLTSLALILNREIPAQNRTRLAYIDLRLSQRAYYCYNESACVEQPIDQENPENAQEEQ
jgi:hypothetical protein